MQPDILRQLRIGRFIFVAMAVTVLLCGGAEARKSRRPDYCRGQTREQSFLWRVETKPPSYFFGTIHVPYNRVWDHIPENVKRAFHIADAVYFELDLTDAGTVSALTRCQQLPRGARLRQILPRDIYRRLQKHLAYVRHMMPLWMTADQRGRGLYADYLFNAITGDWQQKRPIWVMLMVNTLTESDVRSRGVPVLDLYLAQEADKLQKRTGAVERVEEQCLPLNGLNISQVVFALNQTLHQHESIRAGAEAPTYSTDDLIRHYNCGDLDEVIFRRDSAQIPPSVFQVPPLQSAASAAAAAQRLTATSIDSYFREELIYKRNQRMGERILELLWANPDTSYFFAFGAGHFLGNFTVLDVLRQAGYKVTAVGPHERIRRYKRRRRPEERRRADISPEGRQRSRPSEPEETDFKTSTHAESPGEDGRLTEVPEPLPPSPPEYPQLGGSPQYKQLEVPVEFPHRFAPRGEASAEDSQFAAPPVSRSGGPVQYWRGSELPSDAVPESGSARTTRPGRPPAPSISNNKYTDNFSDLWVRIDSGKSDSSALAEDRSSLRLQQSSGSTSSTSASSCVVPTTSAALLTALLLILLAVSPPRT